VKFVTIRLNLVLSARMSYGGGNRLSVHVEIEGKNEKQKKTKKKETRGKECERSKNKI
jgi:hypothetical protein